MREARADRRRGGDIRDESAMTNLRQNCRAHLAAFKRDNLTLVNVCSQFFSRLAGAMFVVASVAVLSFSAPLLPLLQSAGRGSVAFCGAPLRPSSMHGCATATGRHGARCGVPLFCTRGVLDDECPKPSVQLAALLVAFMCHVAAAGVYIRLPLRWASVDVGGDSVVGSLLAMAIGGAAMLRRRSSEQLTPDGGLPISLPWSVPSQTRYELLEATAALLAAFLLSGCVGSSL